jgi:hypothetical protein
MPLYLATRTDSAAFSREGRRTLDGGLVEAAGSRHPERAAREGIQRDPTERRKKAPAAASEGRLVTEALFAKAMVGNLRVTEREG